MEVDITLSNQCFFRNILDKRSMKIYGKRELSTTQKSTLQRCSQKRDNGFIVECIVILINGSIILIATVDTY